jgi:hypothetical protein
MAAEALSAFAAALRTIGGLGGAIATEAAPAIQELARASAKAGTTPGGAPWLPRKSDGKRALVNAASAITAKAVADVVFVILAGVNVFHNSTRRILIDPASGAVPRSYVAAIHAAAKRVIGRAL